MKIFITVISTICLVAGVLLNKFYTQLKAQAEKTETKVDDMALEIAINVVSFVNEYFNNSTNESKKNNAVNLMKAELISKGIELGNEKVSDMIEMAVSTVKAKGKEEEADTKK